MRRLNAEQKRILVKHYKTFGTVNLNLLARVCLEQANDYETLYQDAMRFLNDYSFKCNWSSDAKQLSKWVSDFR